jgi:pyruvate kinase
VLLSDGRIELRVLGVSGPEITCEVRVGGILKSHQGVNLPDLSLPIAAVTKKDLADLTFGLRHDVDWVAMSFVRRAEDLEPLRRLMRRARSAAGVIAKIEKHEAVLHLDEIIAAADGVMVARGDLGVELQLDQVPVLQKQILAKCRRAGKPVIIATQMLETMVSSPRPTRAEVSDVANAVFDGADAVMLSAETAAGRYPTEAVRVMARVAARAEGAFDFGASLAESASWPRRTVTDAIAQATCSLARDLDARAIITATSTGHTALMVAMHRPAQPIVAVTANVATCKRLALVWGVYPVPAPRGRNTDELIVNAIVRAREAGFVRGGDRVVVTAGVPPGIAGKTNLIKVEVVGQHSRF